MSKYKIVWCIGIVSITTALFLSPINIWADFFYESFENGSGEFPDDWTTSSWIPGADFQWEEDTGIGGSKCVSIDNDDTANDARWEREILLTGNTWYNLFGWIKGENIIGGGAGANFCIMGTWDSTAGFEGLGTFDWKKVAFTFQTPSSGTVTIGCRLGYWGSTVTGKAWFDDISIINNLERTDGLHIYLVLESEDLEAISEENYSRWINHLDDAYEAYEELVGDVPYEGEKIGIVSVRQFPGGWAVAGNPIKWFQPLIYDEIVKIHEDDNWSFGILHEIGHDFDLDYRWVWHAEFFSNFKMYYVVETLNARVSPAYQDIIYQGSELKTFYKEMCNNNPPNWECIINRLIEIRNIVGWQPFKQTFRYFNGLPAEEVPPDFFGKFILFMNKLTEFSGEKILILFTDEEYVWVKEQLGGFDLDNDGVPDNEDNCPEEVNGPKKGTCTLGDNIGGICTDNDTCGTGGFCSMDQEDSDSDGIGDACDPVLIELSSFIATPKSKRVILKWSTASEIDNAGFNLCRAESEDGDYEQINDSLISAKGSPTEGASYTFIDKDVQNRKAYYYKLEDIDLNGLSAVHGPVNATPRLIYGLDK